MKRINITFKRTKFYCKCGCGKMVKLGNIFIHGHYAKTRIGWHHSKEAKEKISNYRIGKSSARKGVILSDEIKLKISFSKKGNHLSEEHKQKIRKTIHKIYKNIEIRKKCGHPQIISTEHKQKVKAYMLNAWSDPTFRNKLTGENANNWQGGLSYIPYTTSFNNKLKKYIKDRDNYTCQNPNCSKKAKYLNVHHIDYVKENCSEYNLITLCCSCNAKANFKREYWAIFYSNLISIKYNGKNQEFKRTKFNNNGGLAFTRRYPSLQN